MIAEHRFLRSILPTRWFEAVRTGTKKWIAECPCGHKRDLWDAGGVRWMAAGKSREMARCPVCGRRTWHLIRRKTEEERAAFP